MALTDDRIRGVLRQVDDLQSFLGERLDRVDRRVLTIAVRQRPEWLRGCVRISSLPRFKFLANGEKFLIEHLSGTALADRLVWVVECLTGAWCVGHANVIFAAHRDAVHYRLRWSGED